MSLDSVPVAVASKDALTRNERSLSDSEIFVTEFHFMARIKKNIINKVYPFLGRKGLKKCKKKNKINNN